jgi:hypothetical protein
VRLRHLATDYRERHHRNRGDLVNVGHFWWLYSGQDDDERSRWEGHIQVVIRRPVPEFALALHVGTLGSETPWDGHVTVLGSGLYWGHTGARKLAARLTAETRHKWDGRDLSIDKYHESHRIHWRLWTHRDTTERGEFARWREGSIRTDLRAALADRIWGRTKVYTVRLHSALVALEFPDGTYPARIVAQKSIRRRPRTRRRKVELYYDVDVPQGVPDHVDHSGGWKGDRTMGWWVRIPRLPLGPGWELDARNAVMASIYDRRARSGFRTPDPTD